MAQQRRSTEAESAFLTLSAAWGSVDHVPPPGLDGRGVRALDLEEIVKFLSGGSFWSPVLSEVAGRL